MQPLAPLPHQWHDAAVGENLHLSSNPGHLLKSHSTTVASYDREAEGYADHYWARDRMKVQREKFTALLRDNSVNILDLGCGPGHDADRMRTACTRVIGLDESWGMLTAARKRVPDLELVQANFLEGLPFRSASLGGIWACSSLLHVPRVEFQSLLFEIRRVAEPGAVFFASMMTGVGEEVRVEKRPFGDMTRYFAYYTPEEVVRALEVAFFSVLESHTDDRWISVFCRAT